MASRKEELMRDERRDTNAAASSSSVEMNDELLFMTISLIGKPVEIYAKDGSVYSGIFHTASVHEKDYDIVLKKATMTKKGGLDANIVSGTLIETLIVGFEDIVKIVGKEVQTPCDEITGDDLINAREMVNPNELKGKKTHTSQSRQVGGSQEALSDSHNNPDFQENRTLVEARGASLSISSCEAQSTTALNIPEDTIQQEPNGVSSGSDSSLHDQDQGRPSSDEIICRPSSDEIVNRTATESKLNPEAQTFSPSMLQHRTVKRVSYVPAIAYACRGYVPPNHVMSGRGGPHDFMRPISNDLQPAVLLYPATPQPLLTPQQVHHLYQGNASAAQALQLHMTQSVMANRPPPVMANIPQPVMANIPPPVMANIPQHVMANIPQHVMANRPQQFVMPNHIPVSQPVVPILWQNANPGSRPLQSA